MQLANAKFMQNHTVSDESCLEYVHLTCLPLSQYTHVLSFITFHLEPNAVVEIVTVTSLSVPCTP